MTYDEVIAAFFTAPTDPDAHPEPVRRGAPARRLRDAIEPLAMHSVWSRTTCEALAAEGLDFFASYVGGRAGSLGRPSAAVVAATFAVFEPGMIAGAYEAARAACDRDRLLAVRQDATIESLHQVLGGEDPAAVEHVSGVLQRALAAAPLLGRPLFAGLAELPWPDDGLGRLWRCCELLRELRGDGHVGVLVAEPIDGVEASILTELWLGGPLGAYSGTRGWSPEQLAAAADRLAGRGLLEGGELTDEGRRLRDRVEAATDRSVQAVVAAIGDPFDEVVEQLSGFSARCVAAATFPPDPLKRAAG